MSDFMDFENRYFIKANFILDKPLHVGKGTSLEPVGTDLPVIKDASGNPYIPGSSVKGVLRTQIERILRNLKGKEVSLGVKVLACNPLDEGEKCVSSNKKTGIEQKHTKDGKLNDNPFTKELLEETCLACRLFGSPWIASRVYFKDMALLNNGEGQSIRTEIRDGVGIDRDTGTAKKGVKFDYEIVPADACFGLEVILENVEEWEAGLLALILKLWEIGEIAIGGKTSRGLGWGKLEGIKAERVKADDLLNYLLENKKESVNPSKLIEAFKKKIQEGE